ncbi:hypothetical protein B0T16DRAFT_12567 [Cercophora newfieldiana]|uniref:Uncharacterized protein n=1 Tax=Cercophora newfieldiana TaxID=92897 RepID=A0AA39YMV6_9PEZI|nr:hypothetical protein B0T16DRAFT_12567 [Cercophora newfieldiana]
MRCRPHGAHGFATDSVQQPPAGTKSRGHDPSSLRPPRARCACSMPSLLAGDNERGPDIGFVEMQQVLSCLTALPESLGSWILWLHLPFVRQRRPLSEPSRASRCYRRGASNAIETR